MDINSEQSNRIQNLVKEYTCPVCSGVGFKVIPTLYHFAYSGVPFVGRTAIQGAKDNIVIATCEHCGYILPFRLG